MNLQKEHVLCTPDGKVILVDGPCHGDGQNNDEKILYSIVHSDAHEMHEMFPHERNIQWLQIKAIVTVMNLTNSND